MMKKPIIRDPRLEAVRETVLEEEKREDVEALAEELVSACRPLHSSYLFHPEGHRALSSLCQVISSTPATVHNTSWKDLANSLGLSFLQMGCIENYKHGDFTELTLKTFSQKGDATVATIVDSLRKIKRFDAVSQLRQYIPDLIRVARSENEARLNDTDQGYSSLGEGHPTLASGGGVGGDVVVWLPKCQGRLRSELPITLRAPHHHLANTSSSYRNSGSGGEDEVYGRREEERRQHRHHQRRDISANVTAGGAQPPTKPQVRVCKKVMLSFASDGEAAARRLTSQLRSGGGAPARPPIGVLLLDEHADRVYSNPERFIAHTFAKMDFIIPILTRGYLEALGRPPHIVEGGDDAWYGGNLLQERYLLFIHDLMSKYYSDNCCRNYKIRCLVPDQEWEAVGSHPHRKLDPVLKIYFSESRTEELVNSIYRARK